jgi:membrane-bound ClpP family serine protease
MGNTMNLDIRLPIGLLFTLLGILLVVEGLIGGFGVDLAWGVVMVLFGIAMLMLAGRAAARRRSDAARR